MEEHWRTSSDKLVSAEEGLKPEIRKNVKREKINFYKQFIQIAKLIFYFQLICFFAWSSYTIWETYSRHGNNYSYIFNSGSKSSSKDESLKVLNESSPLILNNVEESLETITTTNNPIERVSFSNNILSNDDELVTTMKIFDSSSDKNDIFIINPEEKVTTNPFENTSTYKSIEDSSELQIDDYKNKMENAVSSSEIIENKDKDEQAVLEWYTPLFSNFYMDSKSSIDNSSKEIRNSETEESDLNSDEYNSASENKDMEILSMRLNLINILLSDLSDNYSSSITDDLVETKENSSIDEKSEYWSPDVDSSDILENLKLGRFQVEGSGSVSEENFEEKEDPHKYLRINSDLGYLDLTHSFVNDEDLEKSDTSKVEDDTTSELKSKFFPILDWKMEDSSIETSKTEEESTEKNKPTEMFDKFKEEQFMNVIKTLHLGGLILSDDIDPSVNSEKEIESGQRQENNNCVEDIIEGIKVLRCDSIPLKLIKEERDFDIFQESNDDSSFNPFSDSSTEGNDESTQNTYSFIDPHFPINFNSNGMKLSNENIPDNYGINDQEAIEDTMDFSNFESGKPDISSEWGMNVNPSTDAYLEENSYQDTEDPIRWWLDLSRYHEKEPVFGD
ncbi:hypothetical protein M0804_010248 [Polistes exclamans]|nr:hypothetical protein M0804_010248 [Polistes exclamans]